MSSSKGKAKEIARLKKQSRAEKQPKKKFELVKKKILELCLLDLRDGD